MSEQTSNPTSGTRSRPCRRQRWKNFRWSGLRTGINRVSKTVPFYKKKLSEAGLTADSIRSLKD